MRVETSGASWETARQDNLGDSGTTQQLSPGFHLQRFCVHTGTLIFLNRSECIGKNGPD